MLMTPVLGMGGDWEELRSGALRDAWGLNDVKRNGLVLGIEKEQWRGRMRMGSSCDEIGSDEMGSSCDETTTDSHSVGITSNAEKTKGLDASDA
ncbi:hypothetical protein FNV43_RR00669 [Rhamnella rubrinervis]|uniref:Uncharacterized protein n=1 Tax=Rhamnella rubrinervis TaxID=2594499 RepID=A0A8K0HP08_9ROSA|nr:hypothetical protein FNV43_RR00669 [Rhamnella rubrinervis]